MLWIIEWNDGQKSDGKQSLYWLWRTCAKTNAHSRCTRRGKLVDEQLSSWTATLKCHSCIKWKVYFYLIIRSDRIFHKPSAQPCTDCNNCHCLNTIETFSLCSASQYPSVILSYCVDVPDISPIIVSTVTDAAPVNQSGAATVQPSDVVQHQLGLLLFNFHNPINESVSK